MDKIFKTPRAKKNAIFVSIIALVIVCVIMLNAIITILGSKFDWYLDMTDEELAEQKALHKEYIASYRASLRGILDNTVIERPDGTREQLKKNNN